MGSFFDQFADLDKMKEKAEQLWERGVRETRRQTSLAQIRLRLLDLQRRKNEALNDLGAKVWEMHRAGTLSDDALAAAFAPLEVVAQEIADAEADIQQIREADTVEEIREATADNAPVADGASPEPGEAPRNLE